MLIVFRGWYFAGLAGLGLVVYGGIETRLSMNAATEPESISMAELEQGKRPSQPYVKIDEHYAVYPAAAYETRRDRVKDAIYPMLSKEHPWLKGWEELNAKYPNPEDIPMGEVPPMNPIKVLALTDRFARVSEIPDTGAFVDGVEGIFYPYKDLMSDEQELVRLIEDTRYRQTVVIEIGRKPKPFAVGLTLLSMGIASSVLAVWLFFRREVRSEPEPVE